MRINEFSKIKMKKKVNVVILITMMGKYSEFGN